MRLETAFRTLHDIKNDTVLPPPLIPNIENPEWSRVVDYSADPFDMRPAAKATVDEIKLKLQEGRLINLVVGDGHIDQTNKDFQEIVEQFAPHSGHEIGVSRYKPATWKPLQGYRRIQREEKAGLRL